MDFSFFFFFFFFCIFTILLIFLILYLLLLYFFFQTMMQGSYEGKFIIANIQSHLAPSSHELNRVLFNDDAVITLIKDVSTFPILFVLFIDRM